MREARQVPRSPGPQVRWEGPGDGSPSGRLSLVLLSLCGGGPARARRVVRRCGVGRDALQG